MSDQKTKVVISPNSLAGHCNRRTLTAITVVEERQKTGNHTPSTVCNLPRLVA